MPETTRYIDPRMEMENQLDAGIIDLFGTLMQDNPLWDLEWAQDHTIAFIQGITPDELEG